MKYIYLTLFIIFCASIKAQNGWELTFLSDMPVSLTHNTIIEDNKQNPKFVYSFGGYNENTGWTKNVYIYDISDNIWDSLTVMPSNSADYAYKASLINEKIYLIGGADDTISNNSNQIYGHVLIFDVENETFINDGQNMLVPVYNHVQCSYNDSLIYIISGYNGIDTDTTVQIYDTFNDYWIYGTGLPNNSLFVTENSNGYLYEENLYYFGGSLPNSINASGYLRKGVINGQNPGEVEWSFLLFDNQNLGYNSLIYGFKNNIFIFPSASEKINYLGDKISDGSKHLPEIVHKHFEIEESVNNTEILDVGFLGQYSLANLGSGNWLITGGIDSTGNTSMRTVLISNPLYSNYEESLNPPFFAVLDDNDYFIIQTENLGNVSVYDISGRTLYRRRKQLADLKILKSNLKAQILIFVFEDISNVPVTIKKVNVK